MVSLVLELQGDSTKYVGRLPPVLLVPPLTIVHSSFQGAGFSLSGTKEVLSSIASDCMVEEGECLNAVEVFWTPSEATEVLNKNDVVLDFPELIDL